MVSATSFRWPEAPTGNRSPTCPPRRAFVASDALRRGQVGLMSATSKGGLGVGACAARVRVWIRWSSRELRGRQLQDMAPFLRPTGSRDCCHGRRSRAGSTSPRCACRVTLRALRRVVAKRRSWPPAWRRSCCRLAANLQRELQPRCAFSAAACAVWWGRQVTGFQQPRPAGAAKERGQD